MGREVGEDATALVGYAETLLERNEWRPAELLLRKALHQDAHHCGALLAYAQVRHKA